MAIGPGKYDDLCTHVRTAANAGGAVVVVFAGDKGTGFSCQLDPQAVPPHMVIVALRAVIAELEKAEGKSDG